MIYIPRLRVSFLFSDHNHIYIFGDFSIFIFRLMEQEKKTIIVTGSNKGIGYALVDALAR